MARRLALNPVMRNDHCASRHVVHVLPDLNVGGGQRVVINLIANMSGSRWRHSVCYVRPPAEMRASFQTVCDDVVCLGHRGFWSCPLAIARLLRHIQSRRADIIHINGTPIDKLYGEIAALWEARPVVYTLHGPMWRPGRRWSIMKTRARHALERFVEPRVVEQLVAVSEPTLQSWRTHFLAKGIPMHKMRVIVNGVPVHLFELSPDHPDARRTRREFALDETFPVLVNVGRLDRGKGQDTLVRMMPRIRSRWRTARLLLVGDGPDRPRLEGLVRELGLTDAVGFAGSRSDVPALLAAADAFVMASVSEGLPLAVMEAMAAAKPVIALRISAIESLIDDGVNGVLVSENSPEAMAAATIATMGDKRAARGMGQVARALARERFDSEQVARRIEAIYDVVIDERCGHTEGCSAQLTHG